MATSRPPAISPTGRRISFTITPHRRDRRSFLRAKNGSSWMRTTEPFHVSGVLADITECRAIIARRHSKKFLVVFQFSRACSQGVSEPRPPLKSGGAMTFYDPTLYGRDEEEEFGDSGAYSESLEEDFEEEEEEEESGTPSPEMGEPTSIAVPPPPAPRPKPAPSMPSGGGGGSKPAAKKKSKKKAAKKPAKKKAKKPAKKPAKKKAAKKPAKKAKKKGKKRR